MSDGRKFLLELIVTIEDKSIKCIGTLLYNKENRGLAKRYTNGFDNAVIRFIGDMLGFAYIITENLSDGNSFIGLVKTDSNNIYLEKVLPYNKENKNKLTDIADGYNNAMNDCDNEDCFADCIYFKATDGK